MLGLSMFVLDNQVLANSWLGQGKVATMLNIIFVHNLVLMLEK